MEQVTTIIQQVASALALPAPLELLPLKPSEQDITYTEWSQWFDRVAVPLICQSFMVNPENL